MATAAARSASPVGKIAATLASHGILEIPESIREANLSRLVTLCSQKRLGEECRNTAKHSTTTTAISPPPSFAATFYNTAHLMLFFLNNGMPRHAISRTFRDNPSLARIPYNREKFSRILQLLRGIGGGDQTLHRLVSKVPDIFAREPEEIRRTIHTLRGLKLEASVVARTPRFLYIGNLEEMTTILSKNGVSRAAFGKVLRRWTGAVDVSIEKFSDKIGQLTGCGVRGKNLERFISKYPWFFKSDVSVEGCYPLLKRHGIDGARFARMVAFHPGTLRVSAESLMAAGQVLVSAGIGQGTEVYKSALAVAALTNPKVLESRISRYVGYGFTGDEAREMVRKQPRLLRLSDRFLELKMRFLLHCVKLSRDKMIKSPNYMLYSLEKRLKPRFCFAVAALQEGAFRAEFKWKSIFYFPDKRFQEVFRNISPGAFDFYKRRVEETKKKKKKTKGTRKVVKLSV